jgi:hypothetical protein
MKDFVQVAIDFALWDMECASGPKPWLHVVEDFGSPFRMFLRFTVNRDEAIAYLNRLMDDRPGRVLPEDWNRLPSA